MATYLITGANRGLGLEFLRQYSAQAENTVIGLVRNKSAAEETVKELFPDRANVHFVEAELENYKSLQEAIHQTGKLIDGKLDYVIANAAALSASSAFSNLEEQGEDVEELESDLLQSFKVNVVGNINLFNLTLPLLRQGKHKKAIAISTGMAAVDLIREYDIDIAAPYSISKAALNAAVAKFSAIGRQEGILFMSLSPGFVKTSQPTPVTKKEQERLGGMVQKFAAYAPHFTRAATPEESVTAVRKVIEDASIEAGFGGSFVSHLGNQQWL